MLEDLENKGMYVAIFISIIVIAGSGIFFGVTYFFLDEMDIQLRTVDCVITDNTLVSSCQELFALGIYPLLALRTILIWASYFFIFGLVVSLLVLGYRSGTSPGMMGVMVVFIGGITYFAIELSNIYRTLLENDIFRIMMVDFTVYNKIMIYFPWFIFFVGLFAMSLGVINYQRTSINTPEGELAY